MAEVMAAKRSASTSHPGQVFDARLHQMVDGALSPAAIDPIIDAWTAGANPVEAAAAPAGLACDFPSRTASFKQFVIDRAAVVKSRIP